MIPSTPAVEEAMNRKERRFAHRLFVDWNNDRLYDHPLSNLGRFVKRTVKDQSLEASAPEELFLIEGAAAGQLEVTLAGDFEGTPLSGHFAPYNGRSAFYTAGLMVGVAVVYEMSIYTETGLETYPAFTGIVSEFESDRETGEVTLFCKDLSESMQNPVDIAAYARGDVLINRGQLRGGLIDSSAIIDLCARSSNGPTVDGGFTMGPGPAFPQWYPHTSLNWNRILSIPFHGSLVPEVGLLSNNILYHDTEKFEDSSNSATRARKEMYARGPYDYLACNAVPAAEVPANSDDDWVMDKRYWMATEGSIHGQAPTGSIYYCGWLWFGGANTSPSGLVFRHTLAGRNSTEEIGYLQFGTGGFVWTGYQFGSNAYEMTTGVALKNGWNFVEWTFAFNVSGGQRTTESIVRVNQDDVGSKYVTMGPSGSTSYVFGDYSGHFIVSNRIPISDLEVFATPSYIDYTHLPYRDLEPQDGAEVSWGRNRLTYTLRDRTASAWDTAKAVAAAEFGAVWFDERGRFLFKNYQDIVDRRDTIVKSVGLDQVSGLKMRMNMNGVCNVWTFTTKKAQLLWNTVFDYGNDAQFNRGDATGPYINDYTSSLRNSGTALRYLYVPADPHMACPENREVINFANSVNWRDSYPLQGKRTFRANSQDFAGSSNSSTTEYVYARPVPFSRDYIQLRVQNLRASSTYDFIEADPGNRYPTEKELRDGSDKYAYFRLKGSWVAEEEPLTWTIRDQESISEYGERHFAFDENFWMQDRFQTDAMLRNILKTFGRPIPVTDDLVMAGDFRVQLLDCLEIRDRYGMGERIKVQVLGIRRELSVDNGLVDTYKVEVIETPADFGIWDSETLGIWDQSFIWQ